MSTVTEFGPRDRPLGKLRYRTLPQILAEEQLAFAAKMRARNLHLMGQDLKSATVEDRMGASLLRAVLNRVDVVLEDGQAAVLRVVVPQTLLQELELWGSDNVDVESNHDIEGWAYQVT